MTVRDGDIIVSGAEGLARACRGSRRKDCIQRHRQRQYCDSAASGIYVVNVEGLPSVKVIVR